MDRPHYEMQNHAVLFGSNIFKKEIQIWVPNYILPKLSYLGLYLLSQQHTTLPWHQITSQLDLQLISLMPLFYCWCFVHFSFVFIFSLNTAFPIWVGSLNTAKSFSGCLFAALGCSCLGQQKKFRTGKPSSAPHRPSFFPTRAARLSPSRVVQRTSNRASAEQVASGWGFALLLGSGLTSTVHIKAFWLLGPCQTYLGEDSWLWLILHSCFTWPYCHVKSYIKLSSASHI